MHEEQLAMQHGYGLPVAVSQTQIYMSLGALQ